MLCRAHGRDRISRQLAATTASDQGSRPRSHLTAAHCCDSIRSGLEAGITAATASDQGSLDHCCDDRIRSGLAAAIAAASESDQGSLDHCCDSI